MNRLKNKPNRHLVCRLCNTPLTRFESNRIISVIDGDAIYNDWCQRCFISARNGSSKYKDYQHEGLTSEFLKYRSTPNLRVRMSDE